MTEKKKESMLYLEPDDKKMISQVAWRSMVGSGTYNYENMQALVFLYAMFPVINRYYDKPEDRIKAYKRHFTLFNITPAVFGFVSGLTASMEKMAARDPDYDVSAINGLKVSLMGPLSGIGDSIFWGALKVVATGIGVSFALQGNILGPILYFLVNFIPGMCAKLLLPKLSFKTGITFFSKLEKEGVIPVLTKSCNIVGLMTIGAMATTMVKVNIPLEMDLSGNILSVQSVLDGIMPNLLPVGLTLLMFHYIRKNVQPMVLILLLIVVGIVLKFFGIM